MNLKKLLIGTAVAASVIGGGIIIPAATTTAPASAMNVCQTIRVTHTDATCKKNHPNLICTYYTYKTVCGN